MLCVCIAASVSSNIWGQKMLLIFDMAARVLEGRAIQGPRRRRKRKYLRFVFADNLVFPGDIAQRRLPEIIKLSVTHTLTSLIPDLLL